MIAPLLLLACAPPDPASDANAPDTSAVLDTAGWWSATSDTAEPPPAEDCAAATAAEEAGPVQLDPVDGAASHYALVWLSPEGDADTLRVDVTDGLFNIFDVEAFVYQVPPDMDVALELRWVADLDGVDRGIVATADAHGLGDVEQLNWPGTPFVDDSGTYEVVVWSLSGGACDTPVWVQVLVGGW
jgi:hypothetical protein